MLKIQALNTCTYYLRGAQPFHRLKFVRPLEDHVGAIFRSWVLLACILRFLLLLWSLLRVLGEFRIALGSILERFGVDFGGNWTPTALLFEVFWCRAAVTADML